MAAKKKTSKKKTGKAITTPWQQRLAEHAKKGKAPKEKPVTGDYISTKGSKFTLNGVKIGLDGKGLELDAIVIGYIFEKCYYDTDYKEGQTSAPLCFALGYDEDELAPHADVVQAQHDNCEGCDLNEWGSGRGDGKACADRRRLALAFPGTDGQVDLKMLNIAPTTLKNWKAFINDIESQGLEPMQCAVRISFDEDSTAPNPPLVFEFVNEITNSKQLDVLASLLDKAEKMLEQPYDPKNYSKGKKKASKKKSKKKATARRRSKLS